MSKPTATERKLIGCKQQLRQKLASTAALKGELMLLEYDAKQIAKAAALIHVRMRKLGDYAKDIYGRI